MEAFAQIPPGLEDLLVAELGRLGVPAVATEGGATFAATPEHLARVHGWSWLAGRVLVRLGKFSATTLAELATGLARLPWRAVGVSRQPVEVDVVATKSRLRFRDTVGTKTEHAVHDALRGAGWPGQPRPPHPIGVHLRIVDDRVHVSVDASGERLHKRGWRLATAKAPLRETLASAVLDAAGWAPGEALVDPFCGSGTFVIEAARRAAGKGPRVGWHYAFQDWPGLHGVKPSAGGGPRPVPTRLFASDRDAGAVQAARDNARRAEVLGAVELAAVSFESLAVPDGPPGLLVANLPWGQRVGHDAALTRLYTVWGEALRTRWTGWRAVFLVADSRMLGRLHPGARVVRTFDDGGVRVSLGLVERV